MILNKISENIIWVFMMFSQYDRNLLFYKRFYPLNSRFWKNVSRSLNSPDDSAKASVFFNFMLWILRDFLKVKVTVAQHLLRYYNSCINIDAAEWYRYSCSDIDAAVLISIQLYPITSRDDIFSQYINCRIIFNCRLE